MEGRAPIWDKKKKKAKVINYEKGVDFDLGELDKLIQPSESQQKGV
jgi:hypothetical protein